MVMSFDEMYGVDKSSVLTIWDECGGAFMFFVGGPIGVMERVIIVGVADDMVVSVADDVNVVIGDGAVCSVVEPDKVAAKLAVVDVDEGGIFEADAASFVDVCPFETEVDFFAFSCWGFPGVGRTMVLPLLPEVFDEVKRFFETLLLDVFCCLFKFCVGVVDFAPAAA